MDNVENTGELRQWPWALSSKRRRSRRMDSVTVTGAVFGTGPGHGMMDMMGRMQGMMAWPRGQCPAWAWMDVGHGRDACGGRRHDEDAREDGDGDVTVEEARSALDGLPRRSKDQEDNEATLWTK